MDIQGKVPVVASVVAIIGAMSGGAIFLIKARSDAIRHTRELIVRTWTNEGDVSSTETHFIDLELQNSDGEIIGSLRGPQFDATFDVSVDVGWHSSTVSIVQLHSRSIAEIARAKVVLTGNDNRLELKITSSNAPAYFPQSTTLWPLPAVTQ